MKQSTQQYLISNLRQLMDASELKTQSQLAKASGVSQTNISNIMRGEILPTIGTVEALAAAFGLESWQLLTPNLAISLASRPATIKPAA